MKHEASCFRDLAAIRSVPPFLKRTTQSRPRGYRPNRLGYWDGFPPVEDQHPADLDLLDAQVPDRLPEQRQRPNTTRQPVAQALDGQMMESRRQNERHEPACAQDQGN